MVKLLSRIILAAIAAMISLSLSASGISAGQRYATPPPLVISPDLSRPLMLQLRGSPSIVPRTAHKPASRSKRVRKRRDYRRVKTSQRQHRRTAVLRSGVVVRKKPKRSRKTVSRSFNPALLPKMVEYLGPHKPGTVIINTPERRLYLVMSNGKARRYGIGVGKPGFEWAGTHNVTRKAEWPSWRPPVEMIAREKAKGRNIPAYMAGGPNNPLGARAMYLGSTIYRIHGSNQPWSIGKAVSSGCIRMRNQDAVDLYERVKIGTKVVVL
jgi:lipoprotein-anchoring transpeptidase ErfK/SrfK